MSKSLVFIWETIDSLHADRCDAVAKHFSGEYRVVAIEICNDKSVFRPRLQQCDSFELKTLFTSGSAGDFPTWKRVWKIIRTCLETGASKVFLCHYETSVTFLTAIVLRLLRRQVFVMNNSKFDDKQRGCYREALKTVWLFPYNGALTSGARSKDYIEFLGVERVACGYNTLSMERVRNQSGAPAAPNGMDFSERTFLVVARLITKKNLFLILDAYANYAQMVTRPRTLQIVGGGPLECALRRKVIELELQGKVIIRGRLSQVETLRRYSEALALILTSSEEQFGNVVIEAQILGLPVIISDVCGARDIHVRSGVNGFVCEADNAVGFAYFMSVLSENEELWRRMCLSAQDFARLGDVSHFVQGVSDLIGNAAPLQCGSEP